jgi:hypothetical protein
MIVHKYMDMAIKPVFLTQHSIHIQYKYIYEQVSFNLNDRESSIHIPN